MLDFFKDNNIFYLEEKIYLNTAGVDVSLDEFISKLSFAITISEDKDCINFMNELLVKVQGLSVEEWQDLQKYLPFELPVSEDDFLYK